MGEAEEQLADELRTAQQRIVELEASVVELERARELLEAAEWEKEAILDGQLEHVVYQDLKHRILWVNRAAYESVNAAREELVGRYCYEVWPQRTERCEDCPVAKAMEVGHPQEVEKTTSDGRSWFIRGYPVRDRDGAITGGIEITQDITDRKQAEEALRREEGRYKLALSATRDGFWEWNVKTNEVYYSPRYYTMLGYEPGEFDASVDSWEKLVEPNDLAAANAKCEAYFRGDAPEYQTEFRVRAKSGEWIWILSRGAIVERDEEGEPVLVLGTHTDITRLKHVEGEQERLQQEVIEAQRQALQELSTPIIPVMERIIVMPLVGSIDTMRARDITRSLLAGIREHRAKVVILDITGVVMVDSGVADHLNKTIQAARLKGARTIVTGISDAVAETIVDLGIDWGGVETLSDLRTGLVMALNSLGIELSK
jgi:rsbT co-antagonist protein RsbR